jgi:acyl-CoA synthetase (AMP-forming)/AMP-acid ligase II
LPASLRIGNRVHTEEGSTDLGALGDHFDRRRVEPLAGTKAPVAFVCDSAREAVAGAISLARSGREGLLLSRERFHEPVRADLIAAGFLVSTSEGLFRPSAEPEPSGGTGRVWLLTSGTTGRPKIIPHTWESLYTMNRTTDLAPHRWLMTYQTGTYAWFQIVSLLMFAPDQELVISEDRDPLALLQAGLRTGATAVSSTPTFWRFALLQAPADLLRSLKLRQITLGGEPIDQALLDQLHRVQPQARVSHIYASTEVGACIVVHDGKEGFPREWLVRDPTASASDRPELRVEDGILWVRSPHASSQHTGWVNTGDAVDLRAERVVVIGRQESSIVNVGGVKVLVHDVERALLQHDAVAWCRVYGRAAPITGALIAADVVPRGEVEDRQAFEAELNRFLRDRFPEAFIPRFWQILDVIPVTENFKTELAS